MQDKLMITTDEAAESLGIPKRQIYALINQGKIPVVKLGKRYYIAKEQLPRVVEKLVNNNVIAQITNEQVE